MSAFCPYYDYVCNRLYCLHTSTAPPKLLLISQPLRNYEPFQLLMATPYLASNTAYPVSYSNALIPGVILPSQSPRLLLPPQGPKGIHAKLPG